MSTLGETPAPIAVEPPSLDMGVRIRLSIMMFLQFAVWGAWFVMFFPYLLRLGFDGSQAGWIFGNMALGAIFGPLLVSILADRYVPSQILMGVLHLVGAGLLYAKATIPGADFPLFFIVSLGYALVFNPTLALSNSISFAHLPSATRDFPGVRVFGTVGWIAANLAIGKLLDINGNEPLLLGAALSVVLGLYSFTLPHTPPSGKPGDAFPFVRALGLFRNPSFAVFFVVSGFITVVLAFYYSNTSTYLQQLDPAMVSFGRDYFTKTEGDKTFINPATTMLLGQISEMVLLPLLPIFLYRFGMKWVLILGMLCWGIRYILFAQMGPFELVLLGVLLHGICFDFFFAAGFIYVDNTAPKDIRASGQALFSTLTYGIGMWLGSVLSGILNKQYTGADGVVDWRQFWMIPAYGVLAAVVVFFLFFRKNRP